MTGEPVVIVSAGDDRFAMPLAVALSSALRHLDPHRDALVFILDDGIDPAKKARCSKVIVRSNPRAALHWIGPDTSVLAKIRSTPRQTRAGHLRLLIPEVLPEHLNRCIYIDSDVVVQRDLSELWTMDFGEYALFAVLNFSNPTLATALPKAHHLIDAPGDTPYFNGGILIMSLSRWRRGRNAERAVDFLIAHQDKMRFPSNQAALFAAFAGRWGVLDEAWNVQLLTLDARRRADLLPRAAILHYNSERKPWHWDYRGYAEHAFYRALLVSGWFGPFAGPLWVAAHVTSHWLRKPFRAFADRRKRKLLDSGNRTAAEITKLVAPGGAFVLVDERWLAPEAIPDRRAIPFLERDGQYWGLPADDETAIRELERLRRAGAGHIVFVWPAFWWLDHYAGFHRHLRSRFPCVLENERLVVFDLRSEVRPRALRRRSVGPQRTMAAAPASPEPRPDPLSAIQQMMQEGEAR
jgi:lipopolysaccharide biosynthesis glycosyltransferase